MIILNHLKGPLHELSKFYQNHYLLDMYDYYKVWETSIRSSLKIYITLKSLKLHQNYDVSHHDVADDCKVGRVHVKHVQRPDGRSDRKAPDQKFKFSSLLDSGSIKQKEFFQSVLYLKINLTQGLPNSCVGVELDHVENDYEQSSYAEADVSKV